MVGLGRARFFAGGVFALGLSLAATRGAAQPTPTLVKDIKPGFTSAIPGPYNRVVVVDGIYYFVSNDGTHGLELWRSDGTADGTFLVEDINPGDQDGVAATSLFPFDGALYFNGYAPTTGRELWRSDGTEAGTSFVLDINAGTDSSSPQAFHTAGGKLFFEAGDSINAFGMGLYVSDGTAGGTFRLMDAEKNGAEDWDCAAVGSTLYCSLQTDSASATRELWATDGTVEGTRLVAPATLARLPQGLTAVGDDVFFWASDDEHGLELWKSDGTETGTVLVKDCAPGTANSVGSTGFLGLYTAFDGGFLFSGSNGTGAFMWITDGTEAGTQPVGDNLGSNQVLDFSWLTSRGPDVFFQGGDTTAGRELWITDGTQSGTRRVKDINPGRDSALNDQAFAFSLISDQLFFVADDGTHDWQLYRSDGTEAGTVRLTNFTTNYDREIRPSHPRSIGSKILFFADDGEPGAKLWSLDVDAPGVTDEPNGSGGGGGSGGTGGDGGVGGAMGGSAGAMGGSVASGGSGAAASGGTSAITGGSGGAAPSGGASGAGNGGTGATGGSARGGAASSTGGSGGTSTGGAPDDEESSDESSGCGCRVASPNGGTPWAALLVAVSALLRRRARGRIGGRGPNVSAPPLS